MMLLMMLILKLTDVSVGFVVKAFGRGLINWSTGIIQLPE